MVVFPPLEAPTAADIPLLLTLLALELVLSFDNAAILAALSNRLPREQRRKALLYGLVGAYVFRVAAILAVILLLENEWLVLIGAAYLIYLAVRHFATGEHQPMRRAVRKPPKLPLFSIFWSTVVLIELADVAFALDQILVAYALAGRDIVIIVIASLIAIIFLRISAYYIGRIMEWFPPLESLAYIAVGFVGVKMVLAYDPPLAWWPHYEIPKAISIAVTFSLIILPPLLKFLLERLRGQKPTVAVVKPEVEELKEIQAGDREP